MTGIGGLTADPAIVAEATALLQAVNGPDRPGRLNNVVAGAFGIVAEHGTDPEGVYAMRRALSWIEAAHRLQVTSTWVYDRLDEETAGGDGQWPRLVAGHLIYREDIGGWHPEGARR